MSPSSFRRRFALVLPLLVGGVGCAGPESPFEEDEYVDPAATQTALGVACVGDDPCSGSGLVYSATYRVGATLTSRGELVQTFQAGASGTPRKVTLVARPLRAFTSAEPPLLHVEIVEPLGSTPPDDARPVLLSASTPVEGLAGSTTLTLDGSGALVSGHTYALRISVDPLSAGATGALLVGIGALSEGTYSGGDAYRRSSRLNGTWGVTRLRPAGSWDLAFAFSGGLASPCEADGDCRSGLLCRESTCVAPNSVPVSINPSTVEVYANTSVAFTAQGGDAPYTYTRVAGTGTVVGATYTAPAVGGTATVRVTDAFGFTDDATITVLPDTRNTTCTGLPDNAAWNTASSITQTFDGSAWLPSQAGTYDATPSTTLCRFKCRANFSWVGGNCLADTQISACTDLPPNASWNTASSITQTWSGSAWLPAVTGAYDPTPSTALCRFKCNANFSWVGGSCVADTQASSCTGLPTNASWNTASSITQTWSGSAWLPAVTGTYDPTPSTSLCRFKCNANFSWVGGNCLADTQITACTGLPSNGAWNTASSITQTWSGSTWLPSVAGTYDPTPSTTACRFKCQANYSWVGGNCVANTQIAACTGLPSNAAWNTASSITQTWSGSAWLPAVAGTYDPTPSTTACRFKCDAGYLWSAGSCVADPGLTRTTCLSHWQAGIHTSGSYSIDPDGAGGLAAFTAYCDMDTDGGGWTQVEYLTTDATGNDGRFGAVWSNVALGALGSGSYKVPAASAWNGGADFRYSQANAGTTDSRTISWATDFKCGITATARSKVQAPGNMDQVPAPVTCTNLKTSATSANARYMNYQDWTSGWQRRFWVGSTADAPNYHGDYCVDCIVTWKLNNTSVGVYNINNISSGSGAFWVR